MKDATDFIQIAVGVLITVLLVAAVFLVVNQGRDMFNRGSEQLSETTNEITGGKFETYNGTTQTGSSVRRLINETFTNKSVEILVCTNDGSNLVYNSTTDTGTEKAITTTVVTGMPNSDAKGMAIVDAGGVGTPTIKVATTTKGSSGYNEAAGIDVAGFISTTSTFVCSVQKDVNGDIRRITFVQN